MKDTRAEIYIKAFDKDGNPADFSSYYYHDKDCDGIPMKDFKQYVKDNAESLVDIIEATEEEIKDVTDLVNGYDRDSVKSNDKEAIQSLIERIETRNGTHTIDSAYLLGVGTKDYTLVNIDYEA